MNRKIKNLSKMVFMLGVVFIFSGCAINLPWSKSTQQPVTQTDANAEKKIDSNIDANKNAAKDNTNNSAVTTTDKKLSDVINETKEYFECGQECKDESCKEVKECLYKHATDCTKAKGRITYSIPGNATKKKVIEHIISGKEGDKCVSSGILVGTDPKANPPINNRFDCKVSVDMMNKLFVDGNLEKFLITNCSGTNVDYLKTKIKL
jgi:hypothetical protein